MTAPVILVLNGGSSSLKYQVVEPVSGIVHARGVVERIGSDDGDYPRALATVRTRLAAELPDLPVAAVGHRVVHGGERFHLPTVVTDDVVHTIRELIPLAPLHNPANAAIIDAARLAFTDVTHVAVFDTAFFADLPAAATTYAIDQDVARKYGIRRYGFHGISHHYVSQRAAALVDRPLADLKQIVLHLGNGASASAIGGGRPVDTSMGLTPLEGLVMGTRGGDIDPGVLIHLLRSGDFDADSLDVLLTRRAGMFGLAGCADVRDVHAAAAGDGPDAARAALALDIYARRVTRYIGAYLAILGGADLIAFTAGVGENDADIRARACAPLGPLGVVLDPLANVGAGERIISAPESRITVAVVPTNEELAIARATADLALA